MAVSINPSVAVPWLYRITPLILRTSSGTSHGPLYLTPSIAPSSVPAPTAVEPMASPRRYPKLPTVTSARFFGSLVR